MGQANADPPAVPDTPPRELENADLPSSVEGLLPGELADLLLRQGVLSPEFLQQFVQSAHETLSTLHPAPPPPDLKEAAADPRSRTGRYVRTQLIGRGAQSMVWKAWDPELGRPVAVKILNTSQFPEDVQRFRREAQLAARLRHPNIVAIHEVGLEKDELGRPLHFIAMDYVDGVPLSQLKLDLRPLLEIIRDCAAALDYAHRRDVVHRDVKPSNILVDCHGRAFLADFGLAKTTQLSSSVTLSGAVLGTPAFMPPEQAQGRVRQVGPRSDVYALGATLYYMLCGRPPFDAPDPVETLRLVVEGDPPPPRKLQPSIPRDVETIVLHCLEKEASRRYATALDLANDLTRCLDGDPIEARRTPWADRLVKKARKHRWVTALSAGLVLAVLGGVLWGFASKGRAQQAAREEARRRLEAALSRARPDAAAFLERRRKSARARSVVPEAVPEAETEEAFLDRCAAERDAQAAAAERDRAFEAAVEAYQAVVALDPGNAEARAALADLHFAAFQDADREGRGDLARQLESAVLRFDAPRYLPRFPSQGRVSIVTDPPGAEVLRFRLKEGDRRELVEEACAPPARAPLEAAALEPGDYVFLLRKEGFRDTRLVVRLKRGAHDTYRVKLYTDEAIGREFVYVPGGPFLMGGDPAAPASGPARVVDVPGFFIGRREVTCAEYLEFVNDLYAADPKQAIAVVPRPKDHFEKETPVTYWTHLPEEKRFALPATWDPRFPVMGISWLNAQAYARWRTERARRAGEPASYRLPTEREWEKAARGPDGRPFPWGNAFHPSLCKGLYSRPGQEARPEPVGAYASDRSPYGVLDMGGGAQEWCADEAPGVARSRIFRGGQWSTGPEEYFRCATRYIARQDTVRHSIGIRLVREWNGAEPR
jgi:serine/threonine-protein kinase